MDQPRNEDSDALLEHLTLDLLRAYFPAAKIRFWRDKQQREIDFVIPGPGGEVTAIECRWSGTGKTRNLDTFHGLYPDGRNLLVTGADKGDDYDSARFCGDGLPKPSAIGPTVP